MNYNILGTGLDITPELRDYVEKKLSHADKFVADNPTAYANVELEFSAVHDGGKYRSEITLQCAGETFRASKWGSAMHEAIDLSMGELAQELSRTKAKKLSVMRRSAVRVKEYLRGWRSKV